MVKSGMIHNEYHGLTNRNFHPIHKFNGRYELMLGLKSYEKEVKVLKEKVPHLFEHIYFIPNQMYNHFCYYKDNVFIDVMDLNWELWETFQQQKRIEYWIDKMEKYEKKKDYETLIGVMEKKILVEKYIELFKKIPYKQKYNCFRDMWRRSEYGFDKISKEMFKEIFAYKEHSQERKEEMEEFFKKIGEKKTITIYRGVTRKSTPYENAISWTLNEETAEFFATRFSEVGRIIKAEIDIEYVYDFIDSRGEDEVLINPEKIKNVIVWKQFAD